jgi:hypothetical protein
VYGQHDSALAIGRRGREIDAGLTLGRIMGAKDLLDAGRPEEARRLALNIEATPGWRGHAAYSLAKTGDTATVRRMIGEFRALPKDTWLIHSALMYAYLGMSDTASALTELERALAVREFTPHWETFADRMFDPVRGSPRWARAVEGFRLSDAGFTRQ